MNTYENKIHSSWDAFFEQEQDFIENVMDTIKNDDYTPEECNIFKFAELPVNEIKCAIIGQDPYPARGAATGLAFEVGNLQSWTQPFAQASLRNILRAVYKAYTEKTITWKELRQKISDGKFEILPPGQLFKSWMRQGVLLLNTSLTCRVGAPNSHRKLWNGFCGRAVDFVSSVNPDVIWFLWGKDAWQHEARLSPENVYVSRHPMLAGTEHPLDFLKNRCFQNTKNMIEWIG